MSSPTLPGKQLNQRPALNPSVPDIPFATSCRVPKCVCLCIYMCYIYIYIQSSGTLQFASLVSYLLYLFTSCFTNCYIVTSWLTLLMWTSQLGCRTETAAVFVRLSGWVVGSGFDYLSRETALTFDLWLFRKNPGCLVAAHVAWLCCITQPWHLVCFAHGALIKAAVIVEISFFLDQRFSSPFSSVFIGVNLCKFMS